MLAQEEITLNEARAMLATRPDISTIYRWALHGCRGIKLEYRRIGRRIVTTPSALQKFSDDLTALDAQRGADVPLSQPRRSEHRREQQIARAEKRLAAAGFSD